MNFFVLFLGLIALINLSLAFFVFSRNPLSWVNRSFVLFVGTLSLWTLCVAMLFTSRTLLWSDLTLFFGNLVGVSSFILFAKHFPENQKLSKKYLFYFFLIPIIIFITLAPFRPFVSGIIVEKDQIKPALGPLYPLLMVWSIFGAVFGIYILLKKYKKSIGRSKSQLKYLFWGFLSFLFIVTLLGVMLPAFGIGKFSFFSPGASLLMVGATSYAIIKHRLLDIRLVVARTVSYSLLVMLLGLFYALIFATLSSIYIGSSIETKTIIVSTLIALFMAFTFQPLRRILEKVTDRIFYKDHYDTKQLLYDLTLIMASTLRLEDLTHQLLATTISQMRLSRGAFILIENDRIYDVIHEGFTNPPELDEQKILTIFDHQKIIIFDELTEGTTKDTLRTLNINLLVQLSVEGERIGLLALGEKRSGEIYYNEDINAIEILAPEAAVAIQNAKAYEEIRRFNITLQEEVDRATKDLQTANESLKELDKLKDEFVSIASHELRTPMTSIKSYLWMIINNKTGDDKQKTKEYLDRAYSSTDRLINLVNDMLDVSRIESGRMKLSKTSFDIVKLTNDVESELNLKAAEKKLKLQIMPNKLPLVSADSDKVHQVLINLVGNAIKFTPENGSVSIHFAQKDGFINTSVSDTGTGISKDEQQSLFKKFSPLKNSLSTYAQTRGSGLGLYISKQIIKLLGGKIWVESEEGKGSTFTFSLPVAKI